MATYPSVTDRERDAALSRIRLRHEKREDPRWSEAEADSDEAAYTVLAYLRKRHAGLPRGLAAANVWDELVLSAWVYWDRKSRERELLRRARHYGFSLAQLGAFLGIGTRQGMRDYLDRAEALLDERAHIIETSRAAATGDGKTDVLARFGRTTRAARGADVHATRAKRRANRVKTTRTDWIASRADVIIATGQRLLDEAARLGIHPHPTEDPSPASSEEDEPGLEEGPVEIGIGDYLAWLVDDLKVGHVGTGTFGTLGLVLGELRAHSAVTGQPANHGIHRAIRAGDQLRASYAELTPDMP